MPRGAGWRRVLELALVVAVASGCGSRDAAPEETQASRRITTHHTSDADGAIPLRDAAGAVLARGATTPYSPERTCGGCHDTSVITRGYHFQQGRTDRTNAILVSDNYNPYKPWILSDGMYGKW